MGICPLLYPRAVEPSVIPCSRWWIKCSGRRRQRSAYTQTNTWSTQRAVGTVSRSELAAPQVVFQRRSLQCSNILF